ncbi:MAG TPA: DUF202 domain-containing protein [Candidatus Binataceae bacterium]|nr:DUF202 domain-containing protein [Candidatus Binataceae bacterium]
MAQNPVIPELDRSTALAFVRTREAYERTMMAWIRTATSLITFGFSIYKFFQLETPMRPEQQRLIGPRQFSIILVSIGIFSLLLATLEHHFNIRALRKSYPESRRSLAVLVAAMVSSLGLIALLAILFRQ